MNVVRALTLPDKGVDQSDGAILWPKLKEDKHPGPTLPLLRLHLPPVDGREAECQQDGYGEGDPPPGNKKEDIMLCPRDMSCRGPTVTFWGRTVGS